MFLYVQVKNDPVYSYNVKTNHLRVKVHIQCLWVEWIRGEVLLKVLVVERLVMRVQVCVQWSFLPQQVVRRFARTCGQNWRGLRVRVESLCVGVLAGGRGGNGKVLGVRPLRVVLRVCVVSLIWQFAPELSQRCAPAAFVLLLGVGSHLVVSRDDAGLLFQHAEHQTLPLGKQAGPRQLWAVQSDPVTVWALEHWGCTWKNMNTQQEV